MREVAIIGIGSYGPSPTTNEVSFREGIYEAAVRAYNDCGIDPRKDVDAFIACEEDFNVGISISNEFSVDQLGARLRPISTVCSESLIALASAYMLIKTGQFDVVVVESHSKASNIDTYEKIIELAMDPLYERFLDIHPYYFASLQARYYLNKYNINEEDLHLVTIKNKKNGLKNQRAKFASNLELKDIIRAPKIFDPLTSVDVAPLCDAFYVFVVASKEYAEKSSKPIWIKGIYWSSGTVSMLLQGLYDLAPINKASEKVYEIAGIDNPRKQIDFAEIDDRFAHSELIHLEGTKICKKGEAINELKMGSFDFGGDFPVNVSGGYLSNGVPLDAGGLMRAYESCLQLRKEAGKNQIKDAKNALILTWRGIPTSTYCAAILSNEGSI